MRFTLPVRSGPMIRLRKKTNIPRILWQTNYTKRVTLAVYINYLFNRLLSPSFEYRFMVTQHRMDFIQSNYSPEVFANFQKLRIGAAQADFWRLLVLNKMGGVYMDIDAHLVWPLELIIKPELSELYLKVKTGVLSNYFMASCRDNHNLEKIITTIMENIRQSRSNNVYDLTGPGVLNTVLDINKIDTAHYRYTCNQGNFTNEYFQYIDKSQGKWTKEQHQVDVIKK